MDTGEMTYKDILYKEIDLIQACINRMAQNSFIVKGWLITLNAVALALAPKSFNVRIVCLVGIFVTICFWYLDAFFLKTEKLYRWKYEWVIKNRQTNSDNLFDLNPYNEAMWLPNTNGRKKEPSIVRVMFTKTLIPLYAILLIFIVLILVNTKTCWF